MELRGYAKINLVLNVLRKLENGYHEVDFLMATVDIYDTVSLSIAQEDEVICNYDIKMEDNIAYKAYLLMKKDFKIDKCLRIKIDKKIPMSAGMAGGSSNAACVIKGINKLFDLGLSLEKMLEIGSRLGSDVPFCIMGSLSRCRNHGEVVEKIDKEIKQDYLVVINPNVHLSTRKVYENHTITTKFQNVEIVINDLKNYKNYLYNDLQDTALRLVPQIKSIFDLLNKYNVKYLVSGSGPTVVAFCENIDIANQIHEDALSNKYNSFLTRILK